MPSVNDKFRLGSGSSRPVQTSITLPKAAGDTTITLTSASGWNTTTGVDFMMYRRQLDVTTGEYEEQSGTRTTWIGELTGSTMSNMQLVAGTEPASGYAADGNTIVVAGPTARLLDDLVEGLLVGHNQDGSHDFTQVVDSNGNEALKLASTAGAVNEITITNAATGNGPTVSATGSDANIDINISPKGTGQVKGLVDKLQNPYKFSAYKTSAQTIAGSATQKILFNVERFDTGNNFDNAANSRFTAPVAGFYGFTALVGVNVGAGDFYSVQLWKNGSVYRYGTGLVAYVAFSHYFTVAVDNMQLAANDYIEVYFQNGSSSGRGVIVSDTANSFEGHLVSTT